MHCSNRRRQPSSSCNWPSMKGQDCRATSGSTRIKIGMKVVELLKCATLRSTTARHKSSERRAHLLLIGGEISHWKLCLHASRLNALCKLRLRIFYTSPIKHSSIAHTKRRIPNIATRYSRRTRIKRCFKHGAGNSRTLQLILYITLVTREARQVRTGLISKYMTHTST